MYVEIPKNLTPWRDSNPGISFLSCHRYPVGIRPHDRFFSNSYNKTLVHLLVWRGENGVNINKRANTQNTNLDVKGGGVDFLFGQFV
jgi:hypothetical protein